MTGYVYMLASQKRGTIYIGVTNDLARRIPELKQGHGSRFTAKYYGPDAKAGVAMRRCA